MLCSKCGKENDNKNKFCSNCGAVLDNTPSQSMPKHKGGKKILLLGIFCCLIIVSIFSFKAYSKYSTYQSGIKSLNAGDYETAKKTFASISDYKDSSNYIDECTYQQALVDLNNETYDNAIIAFEALGDYKDSTTYLEKAKMERKYSLFNQDVDSDKVDLNTILDSPDSVEENISPLYKEWYNSSTGESLVIDAFQINGRDYMVKYVTILDGWADTVFCYVDEPDHTFDILPYFDYFDYISESVDTVDIYDPKSADSEHYLAVTLDEYNQLVAENEEAAAQQPNYSDADVINRTFTAFQNKAKGAYANGAASLYQTSKYSDANVFYDVATRTYTCTMTCEYISNVFDMWGTSTDTYFVTAKFLDNGSSLSMIDLQIS